MQLAPHSPFLGAVFSDLPLAFTKYLQAGRVDNQVGDTPLGGLSIGHFHCASALADTANGMVAPPKLAAPVPTCGTIHSSMWAERST